MENSEPICARHPVAGLSACAGLPDGPDAEKPERYADITFDSRFKAVFGPDGGTELLREMAVT